MDLEARKRLTGAFLDVRVVDESSKTLVLGRDVTNAQRYIVELEEELAHRDRALTIAASAVRRIEAALAAAEETECAPPAPRPDPEDISVEGSETELDDDEPLAIRLTAENIAPVMLEKAHICARGCERDEVDDCETELDTAESRKCVDDMNSVECIEELVTLTECSWADFGSIAIAVVDGDIYKGYGSSLLDRMRGLIYNLRRYTQEIE